MLLDFYPPFASTGDHLVGKLDRALARLAEPRCLLHGDALATTVDFAHRFPGWARSSLPWVFERCAAGALDAHVGDLV
jgi:hypothetical protein